MGHVISEFEWSSRVKATVPTAVASDNEFSLTNMTVDLIIPEDFVRDMFLGFLSTSVHTVAKNIKVISENKENTLEMNELIFGSDIEVPNPAQPMALPVIGVSVFDEVGPFTAGQEGKVAISAPQFEVDIVLDNPMIPDYKIGPLHCAPLDEEFIFATVSIDNEAPVITLKGDNPIIVKQGDTFVDPGATAQDNFDGDVSGDIEISGNVDTSTIGEYIITYTVSDSVGNSATVERTVNVVEPFGEWYTGEGVPSDELGRNGDSYLDLSTGDVYKRDPNTWNLIGSLKGVDGKQGSEILTGSGSPSANVGDVGDLYLDTTTGDLYEKSADGWNLIANLQGPLGSPGAQGPSGSGGSNGGSGSGDGDSGQKLSTGSKSAAKDDSTKATGGKLPKTATSLPTLILIGAFLAIAGGMFFLRHKKVTL